MSANNSPFLRVQRIFPQNMQPLTVEIDRAYTDIAAAVNSRTVSIFQDRGIINTGERWGVSGELYTALRKVFPFTFTASPFNILHEIQNFSSIRLFTKIGGTFTDGSIWYPLPYVNVAAANNQVSLTVTSTNIVITTGGGAPPAITSGFVVLEWIV